MKYALLVSRTLSNGDVTGSKNIGDYIQSLAADQFLPHVDEYYDKTSDDGGTETVKMIMNGWYIWQPDKFPLSKRIIPLPISMHISPVCADKLLSLQNVVEWFKRNEPVGCRDKETEKLLNEHGINSYFSGCLTLTLGKKYKYKGEKKSLVFVDPYIASIRKKELTVLDFFKSFNFGLTHFKSYLQLLRKFNHNYCCGKLRLLKKTICTAIFLQTYSKLFSLQELTKADYFTHMIKVGKGTNLTTEEDKMAYAEQLIKKYAASKLVVTSRIHCALPCLGIETPVIFTVGHALEEGADASSAGRFGGLIDFFYVARITKTDIQKDFKLPTENKKLYKKYAEALEKKCEEFILERS